MNQAEAIAKTERRYDIACRKMMEQGNKRDDGYRGIMSGQDIPAVRYRLWNNAALHCLRIRKLQEVLA